MKKRKPGRPSNLSKAAALLGSRGGKRGGPARAATLPAERRQGIASLGGQAGGKARAAALTPRRRSRIARAAAIARWGNREVHA